MKHYHFIGIGGISMSALAAILHSRGHRVSGSDLCANEQTRMLERLGVAVTIGHAAGNLKGCDVVVINGAIGERNTELRAAKRRRIEIMTREELLAQIERGFALRVAVAGTHGKSTTTAMIYNILKAGGFDPTVHNGAVMEAVGANFVLGGREIFITEACEFKRSLLTLRPTIGVITNVDFDHVDCYRDLNDVRETFAKFAANSEVVICTEDCPAESFDLSVLGKHNQQNARVAAAVGREFGISEFVIRRALKQYKGISRRFEKIGKIAGGGGESCDIISDYAHHPAEIKTTIATAVQIYKKFLIIFQPHTYTRTKALFSDFVSVLSCSHCVLFKTYAAREKPERGATARDLARALGVRYVASSGVLQKLIEKCAKKYDAIILTGAGDMIYDIQI